MSYAQTVTRTKSKWHLLTFKCYRFRIGHFWNDYFRTIPLNMSLEPVLAGFGITSAVERDSIDLAFGHLKRHDRQNDVYGRSYLIVYVEIETSRFLILFS